jgi:hypothetical protein
MSEIWSGEIGEYMSRVSDRGGGQRQRMARMVRETEEMSSEIELERDICLCQVLFSVESVKTSLDRSDLSGIFSQFTHQTPQHVGIHT